MSKNKRPFAKLQLSPLRVSIPSPGVSLTRWYVYLAGAFVAVAVLLYATVPTFMQNVQYIGLYIYNITAKTPVTYSLPDAPQPAAVAVRPEHHAVLVSCVRCPSKQLMLALDEKTSVTTYVYPSGEAKKLITEHKLTSLPAMIVPASHPDGPVVYGPPTVTLQ